MLTYSNRNKNKNRLRLVVISIFAFLSYVIFYLFNNDLDRDNPSISLMYDKIYVGENKDIKIKLKDNFSISDYRVSISDGNEEIIISQESNLDKKEIILKKNFPKVDLFFKKKQAKLIVEVSDNSIWNFFMGNSAKKEIPLVFDNIFPVVRVVTKSPSIKRGGSGVIVFFVKDEHINSEDIIIEVNKKVKFKATKFYKDNYYVSLIAWDVRDSNFRAVIKAKDKAGNLKRFSIKIRKKFQHYKTSKITLKDKFLNGKIANLYKMLNTSKENNETAKLTKIEKFININEFQRKKDSKIILKFSKNIKEEIINDFSLTYFRPIRRYATVGSFGIFREFYYRGLKVSTSYHLGLDMASIRHDNIKTDNNAEVVFSNDNGIYGNSIILYHKLGLYTLYSHTSDIFVNVGDNVKKEDIFAETGETGLAMGDHLHFSVIIQGVYVRPNEWLSQNWINENIIDILNNARYIIDKDDK